MREVLCVKCPICGRELHHRVGNGNRKTLRCNLKRHLYNMHQVNGSDAEKYAIELGMGSDGTPLELAIKEWDELVKAGVIKEVTLSATTPDGTTYQQETDIEWQPPPNTAVKVAEMKKEDRL